MRNGKYKQYELEILIYAANVWLNWTRNTHSEQIPFSFKKKYAPKLIFTMPRSSYYDVIKNLTEKGLITWKVFYPPFSRPKTIITKKGFYYLMKTYCHQN